MLTSDLAINWQRGNRITPSTLDADDPSYVHAAGDLIALMAGHRGRRRVMLSRALDEYIGLGTDYRILRGLIKLLSDRCRFQTVSPVEPGELRNRLFRMARERHPVDETRRQALLDALATELNVAAEAVAESLYADLEENQTLIEFAEPEARELLDEYNLAQAQALLYRCVEMTLWVEPQSPAGYRRLFDAIKYYRLIHSIRGRARLGYEVTLSGPVSLFHRSQKYGIRMAVFLPALLECNGWRMRAEIEGKYDKRVFYELDSRQQQLRPVVSDSEVEENRVVDKLLGKWPELGSAWLLERSGEVLDLGETAFAPDLVARAVDGREVYVELMGFWTPRHLAERLAEFEGGGMRTFLLAVSDELRGSREAPATLPPNVLVYKASLDARSLLAGLERL
jgi:predicted nuclease of restriction endonuclease-like RecB superfamily